MTLWEFRAALQGYREAKGLARRRGDISEDRLRDMGVEGFDGD